MNLFDIFCSVNNPPPHPHTHTHTHTHTPVINFAYPSWCVWGEGGSNWWGELTEKIQCFSKKNSEFNLFKRCFNKCGVTMSADSIFSQILI